MSWKTPKTWTTEPLTSIDMNAQIRDNLNALKNPPTATAGITTTMNITATSYADVSGTIISLTTAGGDVMIGLCGHFRSAAGETATLAVRLGTTDHLFAVTESPFFVPFNGVFLIRDVSAGTHSIRLRAMITAGTGQIRVYQTWAREVS